MPTPLEQLNWRERQVLDALLELGEASAQEVLDRLPEPPSYSAVRALLAKLERKGLAHHVERGMRYVYSPAVSRDRVRDSAMTRLVRVFFEGSAAAAVAGMVELSADSLSERDLEELERAVASAKAQAKTMEGEGEA
jgi:predicted transcriptional regulator